MTGTNMFGPLGHKIGRWRAAKFGLMLIGTCLAMVSINVKSVSEISLDFNFRAVI